MQDFNLERIPLPEFSTYVTYTILSLFGSLLRIVYASLSSPTPKSESHLLPSTNKWLTLWSLFAEDTWFFWNVVNCAYCLLIWIGRKLQRAFFGQLRDHEHANMRENISNFIFYKTVFLYGILNADILYEIILWASWFSIVGFLHLLSDLVKDRFEFIMQSSNMAIPPTRLLILLFSLLIINNFLMFISFAIGIKYSLHFMCFMMAEVFLLLIRAFYVIILYAVHLYYNTRAHWTLADIDYQTYSAIHHVRMVFSSLADGVDFVHNLHLLFWNSARLNMSTIVIGMHLQHLYHKLSNRLKFHRHFQRLVNLLCTQLSSISLPNQSCSICWDALVDARKLPCTHVFHAACLHMWLERSPVCPVCRYRLDWQPVTTIQSNTFLSTAAYEENGSQLDGITVGITSSENERPLTAESVTSPTYPMINCPVNKTNSSSDEGNDKMGPPEQQLCQSCLPSTSTSTNVAFRDSNDLGIREDSTVSAMVSINRFVGISNRLSVLGHDIEEKE